MPPSRHRDVASQSRQHRRFHNPNNSHGAAAVQRRNLRPRRRRHPAVRDPKCRTRPICVSTMALKRPLAVKSPRSTRTYNSRLSHLLATITWTRAFITQHRLILDWLHQWLSVPRYTAIWRSDKAPWACHILAKGTTTSAECTLSRSTTVIVATHAVVSAVLRIQKMRL